MSDHVNLDTQVQNGPLDQKYGGTANVLGYAEGLLERYFNRDGNTLDLGTIVSLRDATESGSISVSKTTTLDDPNALGPVVGTYALYGADRGKYEASAPSNDMQVAVLRYGRTSTLSIGSNGGVTRGHYIYAVGSNGQVYGHERLYRGALGRWLSNGSNGATGAMAEIGLPFNMSPYGTYVSANVIIDGGGALITTGQKVKLFFDFAVVIEAWTALGNTTGSAVMELWRDSYTNYPPNSADKITASAPISIPSNSTKAASEALTGWSTSISAGDVLTVNLNTIENFTQITLDLRLRRVT